MKKMISLYEYLGYAAGADLGKQVAYAAAEGGEITGEKYVSNSYYKGSVKLYTRLFLEAYFKSHKRSTVNFH